jgi:hypothetical protein
MENSNSVLHESPANALTKASAFLKGLCGPALLVLAASASAVAQSGGAQFSTQEPTAGVATGTLYVFIPIVNSGGTLASLLQIQSASLGGTEALTPAMPALKGTMAPSAVTELELHFNAAPFTLGNRYLLTLRGTYQVGTSTYGFTVNRFITVQNFTAAGLLVLAHLESAEAINAELQKLPGIDYAQDNQTLLAFIRTRPEFSASGVNGTTVWAQFSDGKLLFVFNGDEPNSPGTGSGSASAPVRTASPTPGASGMRELLPRLAPAGGRARAQAASDPGPPTGLPVSRLAPLFTSFEAPNWGSVSAIDDIAQWLIKGGYNSGGAYIPASVANLKTIGHDDGVVFLWSHGGWGGGVSGQPNVYAVWTTDPVDPDLELVDPPDPDLQIPKGGKFPPLVWATALKEVVVNPVTNEQTKIFENHYAITSQFVTTYWKDKNGGFDPSAFVYVSACDSDNPIYDIVGSGDFKGAVLDAGAGVYAGWDDPVNHTVAGAAARLVFDRLLGADQFCYENGVPECEVGPAPGADADPPVYAQRPFDYESVQYDLTLHTWNGLPLSAKASAALSFTPNPGGSTFGLLAPSIMDMFEGTGLMLYITGNFGTTPGTVQLASSDLGCSWGSYVITCTLPPAGGGPVVVSVNDHMSNPAALTLWQAAWNLSVIGPGSIFESIDFNLQFRDDIRLYRPVIHNPPREPLATSLKFLKASTGTFSCSGQAAAGATTFSWVGSGSLSLFPPATKNDFFGYVAVVNSGIMNINVTGTETFCTGTENPPGVSGPVGIVFPSYFFLPLGTFPVTLDKDANILASPGTTGTNGWYWPPAPSAKGIVKWNMIVPAPDTAPDPHSPR